MNIGIALLYALFSGIAMLINIGTQFIVFNLFRMITEYAILFSIGAGTITGLVSKYILDKKWIFCYSAKTHTQNFRLFILYTVMGGVTTLIFWGAELAFELIFCSEPMRYFGATIGLVIGYWIKYFLDKKFVFV